MYETTLGTRVLCGAEARLFASTAQSLSDYLRNLVPSFGGQAHDHQLGIPVLDSLTAAQVIVLIDRVSAYLLDAGVAAPARTAVLDATIAAIFRQMSEDVQVEIDLETASSKAEDDDTSIRTLVADASDQTSERQIGSLDTPDPECAVMETWQFVIDGLCDRVLPDTDWQLESVVLDLKPSQGSALKGNLGIQDDYFIDIVPDASVVDAASAWCDMMQRITGWRPEQWRFGGGLPMPANPSLPPRFDVLSFPEDETITGDPEESGPGFRQSEPVQLSDVIDGVESNDEAWSSYLDRRNGQVVGLPSDTVQFVEEGEDPDGYLGEGGEEFLELAREICSSQNYLSLPGESSIHEWAIMRDFCATVDDDSDREMLLAAIHGSEAFRSFKSTIARLELQGDWYDYKAVAIERVVISWLEMNSISWTRTEPGETPF